MARQKVLQGEYCGDQNDTWLNRSDVQGLIAHSKIGEGTDFSIEVLTAESGELYKCNLLGKYCFVCGSAHEDTLAQGRISIDVESGAITCYNTEGHYEEICGATIGYVVEPLVVE